MKGPVGLRVLVGATLIMSLIGLSFATPPAPSMLAQGRAIYEQHCLDCHGAEAMGPELSLCPLDQVISSLPIHRPSPIRTC